jgi:inhibitor of cysteine peptidase
MEVTAMRRFVMLSTLFIGMALWSCGGLKPAVAEERTMADMLITQPDHDQERRAVPGQRVLIQLAENITTGYQWQIEEFDSKVLSRSGSDFASSPDGRLGGAGLRTFVFMAQAPGRTTVRLRYCRPWEAASQGGEVFSVSILVLTKAQP